MQSQIVINICGQYPENFIKEDIASNPNYVFKNDLSYSSVQVFNQEGNSVIVNSFIECEHYVTGGWDYLPTYLNEVGLQAYIAFVAVSTIVFRYLFKKFVNR